MVVSQSNLPWLQDTRQDNVWGRWDVRWRDVRIVDAHGELQAIYNLTDYDLSIPKNFSDLKQLFLDLAKAVDSDADHLPDDWEMRYIGNLLTDGTSDSDGDGYDNHAEYAFGSDPLAAKSQPVMASRILVSLQKRVLNFTFRRRAGDYLSYVIESSPGLNLSFGKPAGTPPQPKNLFDGSGTIESSFSIPVNEPQGFLRLRVAPRR